MANILTLTTPLMRQSVGFDRFNDLFETLLSEQPQSFDNYPPYNIEKHGDDSYRIMMAVAGFTLDDLELVIENGELTVTGDIQERETDDNVEVLHRGIGNRAFKKTFRLADYIRVKEAEMKDGLLTIYLEREIPEEKKPRFIPISGKAPLLGGKNH
jgi:molecular chaperone IbpA